MPQIPTYQPRILPQSTPLPRLDPRLAGSAGAGLAEAGKLLSEYADKREKAQRAVELGKATNAATRELEQLQLDLENDPDYANAEAKYQAGVKAIAGKYGQGFSSDLGRAEFAGHFEKLSAAAEFQVKRAARKKLVADAEAVLDDGAELQARRAANATNDLERDAAIEAYGKQLADARDAGLIDPNKAGDRFRAFRGRVAETAVLRDANADAEATATRLLDPKAYPELEPKSREQLIRSVQARADAVQRERIAAADRAERLADKRLRQEGDETAKVLDALNAEGRLRREDVERFRRVLSPTEYRGFLKALKPDEGKDDPATLAALQPRLHAEDVGPELTAAFEAGRLRPETYRTMFNQNRTALRDDAPASPFKSGRGYLAQSLDPGQLGADPAIRQGLAIAQQRALADYDSWAEANPGFDRATALKKSDELLAQYQTVAFGELRLALARPRGFTGRKQDVEIGTVETARSEVLRLLDTGALSRTDAARELEQLEIWERILTPAPKKAAAK